MKENYSNRQINDLDEAGYRERVARFGETAEAILADIKLERITPEEIEAAVAPLDVAEKLEKDEYGNYIIDETKPLAPPVAEKSTPEGRASLETLTSRRSDSSHR